MNLTCEQCRLHHVSGGTSYCGIDRAPAYKPDSCRHDAIPDLLSDLAALESENAGLLEIVEKLPLTNDGVRVVPGEDNVWRITKHGDIEQCEIEIRQPYAECCYVFVDPTEVPNCYSTRAAAEAARGATP